MNSRFLPSEYHVSDAVMDYETLLANLGDKDRASIERQRQAHEIKLGADSADRWRRLVCVLRTLATGPVKLAGSNAMQFFIPDGKYRKQVFALQVLADGALAVYVPDVLAEAVQGGLLCGPIPAEEGAAYHLPESGEILAIDALDVRTPAPDAFYKDLTGWNRKALRMTLPPGAGEGQLRAVRQLCALAAAKWAAAPAAA